MRCIEADGQRVRYVVGGEGTIVTGNKSVPRADLRLIRHQEPPPRRRTGFRNALSTCIIL